MPSRRVPHSFARNAWAERLEARQAAGAPLLDLTEANPTRTGLGGALEPFVAAARDPSAARYVPDPRGLFSAREAVAACVAARGARIDPAHVVLASGTSEAYAHLFRLLADPGDTVLAPAPSYPLFEPLAALEGVTLRPYRLGWDGAWHLDRDSVDEGLAGGAGAVIVVEPNHPTGTCLDAADRTWLIERCAAGDAAIVADEVFGDFGWDGRALPTFAGTQAALTFVLGGLSKMCGLPQLKLAWIAASGPAAERDEALRGLEWIADLFLSVATPVQLALPELLEGRHAWRGRVLDRIVANLGRLDAWVREHPQLDRLDARGGWVAVVRLPRTRSDEEWALALLDRGVVVHPGHFYNFAGDGHVVISLIVEPAVMEQALWRASALLSD
jgi:alanine-synthesizing transaminase